MKLSFYFDVFSFTTPDAIYPTLRPSERSPGSKRYRVDVEIPDPGAPDVIIEGKAIDTDAEASPAAPDATATGTAPQA